VTVGAPLVAPYSPNLSDFGQLFAPPSWDHLFGPDELGRDLFSRLLYGGRTSLIVAFAATVIAMVVGVAWGFAAAFREGWLGELLMRIADMLMAVPVIFLGLVPVAAFGSSLWSLILILGPLFAPAAAGSSSPPASSADDSRDGSSCRKPTGYRSRRSCRRSSAC